MSNEMTQVGYILKVHGTRGEVVFTPDFPDFPEVYLDATVFYMKSRHQFMPVRPESVRPVQKGDRLSFFLKFEHIANRTDAESLKGEALYLPQNQLPESDPDPVEELPGCKVIDTNGQPVGEILDVLENPAHLLLQVKDDKGAFFIPLVDAYVKDINWEDGVVTVTDISGLREI